MTDHTTAKLIHRPSLEEARHNGGKADPQGSPSVANRSRSLITGVLSSLLGRAAGMIAPLVIIPATLQYMGAQRYGLWMAATALTSMTLFADFGIGNGVLTKLARSHARNDPHESTRIITTAYLILGTISAVLVALAGVLAWSVDWPNLFHITSPSVSADAALIVFVCFGAFAANISLSLIQRIQYAQQQVVQSNLWQAGGGLLSVVAVLVGIGYNISSTALITLVVASPPLANTVNTLFYFAFQRPGFRPRLNAVDRDAAKSIAGIGTQFFLISVLASISLNSDTFLVSVVVDSANAAHYSVVLRVFTTLSLFVTVVGLVLWPANAAALAQGDVDWVRRATARASIVSGAVVLGAGLPLVIYFNSVVTRWIDTPDLPSTSAGLLFGLLVWSIALAALSPLFMVQNSVGILRTQLVGWCVFLPASLIAKFLFVRWYGITGLPFGALLIYVLVMGPSAAVGYRRALRETTQDSSGSLST